MANNPYLPGLRFAGTSIGGVGSNKPPAIKIPIASAYAPTAAGTGVNLHVGDAVTLNTTGALKIIVGSEGTQTTIWGVIDGFSEQWDATNGVMMPQDRYVSGTTWGTNMDRMGFAYVIPMVGNLWEVCCDDASTATTKAAYYALFGENCDLVLSADTTNAGDPKVVTKIDISTHDPATATLQVRLVGFSPRLGIDYSGLNVPLIVECNKPAQAPFNTTGA